MVKLYGIKNCDSVKKALNFFKIHDIPVELIDFKSTPVDCATINSWVDKASIDTLLNTRGTTYRTLGLKGMGLDEKQKKEWLCKENMLIKRPVIEYNDGIIVAFDKPKYEGVFLS